MPIPKPKSSENEKDFIQRCISEIYNEYDAEGQAYAVCKSSWTDKNNMSKNEEVFVLQPKKAENRGQYLSRCNGNKKMRSQFPNMRERMNSCLNSFNSYYKYWSRLEEFGDIPSDSALGECIAREKAKGADYKTAYASCSTKVVSPNAPIVLSEDDDLLIEPVLS